MNEVELFKASQPTQEFKVEVTPEAIAIRDKLLAWAEEITKVTTAEDDNWATACGVAIQTQVKTTREAGLALRRPHNARADEIKTVEDDYLAPLQPHLDRIGRLSAVYRVDQERKAEADRQARAAEIARLQEQERQAQEAARTGTGMAAMQADIQATALAKAAEAAIMAPIPEATKTKGQAFRKAKLRYKVTDIHALYRVRPDLCTISEKPSAITACCTADMKIDGLLLWDEPDVSFRRSR